MGRESFRRPKGLPTSPRPLCRAQPCRPPQSNGMPTSAKVFASTKFSNQISRSCKLVVAAMRAATFRGTFLKCLRSCRSSTAARGFEFPADRAFKTALFLAFESALFDVHFGDGLTHFLVLLAVWIDLHRAINYFTQLQLLVPPTCMIHQRQDV